MEKERGCSQSTGTGVPGPPPNQSKIEKQTELSGEPDPLPSDHFVSVASRFWVLGPCRFGAILAFEIPGGEQGLAAGRCSWPGSCKRSLGSLGGGRHCLAWWSHSAPCAYPFVLSSSLGTFRFGALWDLGCAALGMMGQGDTIGCSIRKLCMTQVGVLESGCMGVTLLSCITYRDDLQFDIYHLC